MYRQANELVMNLDNPDNHGWHDQGNVIWSNICSPEDLSELLVDIEDMDVAQTEVDDDFLGDDFEEEDLCVSRTDNKSFSIEYLVRFHARSRYPINIFLHP